MATETKRKKHAFNHRDKTGQTQSFYELSNMNHQSLLQLTVGPPHWTILPMSLFDFYGIRIESTGHIALGGVKFDSYGLPTIPDDTEVERA
jgi:hypothetical protein